jgi:hypothetical protein
MHLHGKVSAELVRLGLSARPNVSLVHQKKQQRWMIAGEEGGGCVGDVGHYTGFVGLSPNGIAVSIPTQSLIPNSMQRRVISQDVIRAQLFRYSNSCNLLVTYHYMEMHGSRPTLLRRVLFQGLNGILAEKTKQPVFFDYAGESVDFPSELIPLIRAVSKGAMTEKNHRAHCITLEAVVLPPEPVIQSIKKPKAEVSPVIEGDPLPIGEVSTVTPASKAPKRKKVSATQTVVPQSTVAPVAVAELVGV